MAALNQNNWPLLVPPPAAANAAMANRMQNPQMGWPVALDARTDGRQSPVVQPQYAAPTNAPLPPEQTQAVSDNLALRGLGRDFAQGAVNLGAAAADIGTLPVRAVMGAANTALRVPNAFGAGIPYIPEEAFGGSSSSLTPYSDRYASRSEAGVVPTAAAATMPPPAAGAPTLLAANPDVGDRITAALPTGAPASQAAKPSTPRAVAAAGGGAARAARPTAALPAVDEGVGSWQRYAAQDRTLFDPSAVAPNQSLAGLSPAQQQQVRYAQITMNMLNSAAGSGGDLGYHARIGALAHAIGSNNFDNNAASVEAARLAAGAHIGAANIAARTAGLGPLFHYMGVRDQIDANERHDARTPVDLGNDPQYLAGDGGQRVYVGSVPTRGFVGFDAGNRPVVTRANSATISSSKPSLQQFLTRARVANPAASDEELSGYYKRTYGGQ